MIKARVHTRDVEDGLRAMRAAAKAPAPVLKAVARALRADIKEHFAEHSAERGAWPGYARGTLAKFYGQRRGPSGVGPFSLGELRGGARERRRVNQKRTGGLTARGKRKFYNMLGKLKSAFTVTLLKAGVRAESIPAWSGVHEYGGKAAHGATIPARSFMWASAAVLDDFQRRLVAHVTRAWRGR